MLAAVPNKKPQESGLGRVIAYYRQRADMSQGKLALRIDVDHSLISLLETGNRNMTTYENISNMCRVLDVPIDEFDRHYAAIKEGREPPPPDKSLATQVALAMKRLDDLEARGDQNSRTSGDLAAKAAVLAALVSQIQLDLQQLLERLPQSPETRRREASPLPPNP